MMSHMFEEKGSLDRQEMFNSLCLNLTQIKSQLMALALAKYFFTLVFTKPDIEFRLPFSRFSFTSLLGKCHRSLEFKKEPCCNRFFGKSLIHCK